MSEVIEWKCGKCFKVFRTSQPLKRHLEEWHAFVDCKICNKTLKRGSLFRHLKIFHKTEQTSMKDNLFTEEVMKLNIILDQQLDRSVEELMNSIDTHKSQQFHNVQMDDYLRVFDEATTTPSTELTEEEFHQIQEYWLNMPTEQFKLEEQNLLEWAAAAL